MPRQGRLFGEFLLLYHRGPKQISGDIVVGILGQREKPQNSTPANARDPHQNSFINSNVVACRLAQLLHSVYPVRKLCCCRRIRTVNRGKFDEYFFNRGKFDDFFYCGKFSDYLFNRGKFDN